MRIALEKDDRSQRRLYLGVFYFCTIVMAAITFYAIYASLGEYQQTGRVVIGEILVDTEFPFPGLAALLSIN